MEWGKGPLVIFEPKPGEFPSEFAEAHGFYDRNARTIEMNATEADALEALLKSDATDDEKLVGMLAWFSTLIHETAHYGDKKDMAKKGVEVGHRLANDVWGSDNVDLNCDESPNCTSLWDTDVSKAVIDEKEKTDEGKATLPRLPKQ